MLKFILDVLNPFWGLPPTYINSGANFLWKAGTYDKEVFKETGNLQLAMQSADKHNRYWYIVYSLKTIISFIILIILLSFL